MIDSERYVFFSKVVLRTPFYGFKDFSLAKMPAVLARQDFRNAIWLASLGFYRVLEKKGFNWDSLDHRQRFTLYKYYNRMSFRPTPFGSFAAFTLLNWSDDGLVRLGRAAEAVLHLLPSLASRSVAGASAGGVDPALLLLNNPTLYRLGQEWRYLRSAALPSGKLVFTVASIDAGKINDQLILLAKGQPVAYGSFSDRLMQLSGCDKTAAEAYIAFLADEQVLLSERLVGLIEDFSGSLNLASVKQVASIPVALMLGEAGDLPALNFGPDTPGTAVHHHPFYAGLERYSWKGGLDLRLQGALTPAITMLSKIVPQRDNQHLNDFMRAFRAKFDGQKVPLLLALDADAGISYGQLHQDAGSDGLLEGISFGPEQRSRKEFEWTAVHRLLLKIWLGNNRRERFDPVIIGDTDIADLALPEDGRQLPPGIAVLFGKAGGKLLIESAGGVSSTTLLGRFSAFSRELTALCREIAAAEAQANPDVVFAEIHQRSHLHVDNISRREQVYPYVIPLNVFAGGPAQGHLLPADLLVSVQNNEILLESISLGKRVIPRLPTAYNYYHTDLALFRFLGDLQFQGLKADLTFNPERLFPGLDYYPRVIYRDCILSLARWQLSDSDVAVLSAPPFSLGRLHLFCRQRGIPGQVSLGMNDQQLVFDLTDDSQALFFLECLGEAKPAVLREYLLPDGSVTAEGRPLAGQFVALLKREDVIYKGIRVQGGRSTALPVRTFLPGSDWLYIKIYCTPQSADEVLRKIIRPVLKGMGDEVTCWFFIRYHDPEFHLRVRFRVDGTAQGRLQQLLHRQITAGSCRQWVRACRYDTYVRELERYSPGLIEEVEALFQTGSDYVLGVIPGARSGRVGDDMEPFKLVYDMCRAFFADLEACAAFISGGKQRFMAEFWSGDKLRPDLDSKYRGLSAVLRETLEASGAGPGPGKHRKLLLHQLSKLSLRVAGWPLLKREMLLADLVHMQINRLFPVRQRQYEAMIYYSLNKYMTSLLARQQRG